MLQIFKLVVFCSALSSIHLVDTRALATPIGINYRSIPYDISSELYQPPIHSFGNANNKNNTPQLKSGYDTFDQHLQVTKPIPPYSKQARRFSSKHDVSASAAEYMSIMWEKTSILSKTKINSGMLRETSKQLRLNSQVDFSAYNDTEPSVNKVHEGRVKRSRQENNEPVEMENILAKDIDSEKSSERGSDKPTEEENSEEDSDESYGMPGRGKR